MASSYSRTTRATYTMDCFIMFLPEPSFDIILRALILRVHEQLGTLPKFHQLTLQKERSIIGNARRLRHVMRRDDDGDIFLDLLQQALDARRDHRVQCRGGFIQHDHLRFEGQDARQAQALLLPTRKRTARVIQPVIHLFPQVRLVQCAFHGRADGVLVLFSGHFQPESYVLEDALGQRDGARKDHADLAPQPGHVGFLVQDVLAVEEDLPAGLLGVCHVDQAVDGAQQRRFSSPRRAEQHIDGVGMDVQVNILERLHSVGVAQAVVADRDLCFVHITIVSCGGRGCGWWSPRCS